MPIVLPKTEILSSEAVFLRPREDGEYLIFEGVRPPRGPSVSPFISEGGVRIPIHLSSWDACELFMQVGYLPPFFLVQRLSVEEVVEGKVARRLWVLRGARRSARFVYHSSREAVVRVQGLKKVVTQWRQVE
jgi:hypothetical protein